jgi:hypothetical protein
MSQPPISLPDARLIREHVVAHAPRPTHRRQLLTFAIVAGLLVVLLIAPPSPATAIGFWALVIGLFVWLTHNRHVILAARRGVRQVQELTTLHRPEHAIQVAWHLMPRLSRWPDMYVQNTMMLAANLMALRAYDPAVEAQSFLLDHVPADHPTGRIIRAQRLLALLHDERLADADDERRALQQADLDPITRAMVKLASITRPLCSLCPNAATRSPPTIEPPPDSDSSSV